MSTSAPVTPRGAEAPSEPQRLLNTFIAPSTTFADLKRKPSWWAPWLIAAILALTFGYAVGRKVGFDQVAEKAVKDSPREAEQLDRLPPAEREQQMRTRTAVTTAIFYGLPLFVLVHGLVIAAVLVATFNFGLGARIPFKTSLAVVFYAFLPFAVLNNLIVMASMMAPGFAPEGFNVQNPTATNLAAFLDAATTPRPLYTLAVGVDVLNIWTVILLGIGFSVVGNLKRSTAIWVVAIWLVLWKLIQAGLAGLGG
jgi:hypothetical protein